MDKIWYDWHNRDLSGEAMALTNHYFHRNYTSVRHRHEYWELNIVVSGNGTHYVDNKEYRCMAGDVYVIPPFISHQYNSDGNLDVHNIMLNDTWMKHYVADCDLLPCFYSLFSPLPIVTPNGEYSLMLRIKKADFKILENLLKLYTTTYPNKMNSRKANPQIQICHNTMMASHAFTIVAFICQCYASYGKSTPLGSNAANSNDFAKSLHYIHAHYNEKISVDELANQASMSYSTYNRIFRKTMQCSPLEYVNDYRISVSKYCLRKGFSIAETASMTGFFDHSHFIKTFVKITGQTPAEYRNNSQKPSLLAEN